MMCLKRLLSEKILILTVVSALFPGCKKEVAPTKVAARVAGQYLSLDQLRLETDPRDSAELYAYVNQWVEREALYNEAKEEGILSSPAFKELSLKAEKEIASALLIERLMKDSLRVPEKSEMFRFYELHKNEFRNRRNKQMSFPEAGDLVRERMLLLRKNKLIEAELEKLFHKYEAEIKEGYK